jgi:hypothetical protein
MNGKTVRAPKYSESQAESAVDAIFARVVAGKASFAELLAAVTIAEGMRDRASAEGSQ